MNYWLHRISYLAHLSYPLLNKGYITIGFSDFTNQEFIDKTLEDDWGYFNESFESEWGSTPRTRHSLWHFLHFKKDDIIIVPSWGSFFICKVVGEKPIMIGDAYSSDLTNWSKEKVVKKDNLLYTEKDEKYDLGFALKVEILYRDVSRANFADAKLTSRMKIRQTNAIINDLKGSVEKSIENYKVNKPIHLHSIIIDKTSNLVLESIKNELNPDKFERLVQTYFERIGANDVTIPAKNETDKEGDADIVAVFENLKLIIYVQAKYQRGEINEWGTNQILDYKTNKESIDDGYNRVAWVITTANSFNENAINIAKQNEIQLVNGIDFSKMLLNVGINLLNKNL